MGLLLTLLLSAVPAFAAGAAAPAADAPGPAVHESAAVAEPSAEVQDAARRAAAEVVEKHAAPAEAPAAAPAAAPAEPAAENGLKATVTVPKVEETKPLPPEEKAPDAAAEWAFVKAAAADPDDGVRAAAVDELALFLRRRPDDAHAPDALVLKAGLQAKAGDWKPAAVCLLRAIHGYPDSPAELGAKSAYLELVSRKASRHERDALKSLVEPAATGTRADRLSALWQALAAKAPGALYEPASECLREFLATHADRADADALTAALAAMHAAADKPAAALLEWRRLLALRPRSALRPAAQLAIGDLYAGPLRDPKRAIAAYQSLAEEYPKADEVRPALQATARLFEEKLKQYALAVEVDERIVKLFPKTPASLQALKDEARLQRDKLEKPADAIETLGRLSKLHGGQDGIDALRLAAKIARSDLKDYARQGALLERVAADYPSSPEAPEALYDAGYAYQYDLKDDAKALTAYKAVQQKFPDTRWARKAASRAGKLSGR
jgi:TolA-binding protein